MTNRPSRRQLRRRARQLRRDGFQPTMFLSPDEPLPETAGAIVVRALWRYRSELAPVVAAAGIVIAAAAMHRSHPGWWPWLMAVTLTDVAVLALPAPRRLRKEWPILDRTAERVYAAAVSAVAGGWLTAATALGPATPPMPALGAILALPCAVPWWASRRRRAKVRLERTLESWPEIARAVGLAGSQVMSAMVDLWGWRARFRLARGQTIHDVIAKIPAIESGLGTFRGAVRVYPTPDNYANRCELRVLDADPHADAIPWPGASVTSITEPIELGPFEDADPCRVSFLRRHVLFGGATGAGKSGGLNVLIGNLSACRDVVLWGIDLKKGMELGPWLSCLDRLATTPDAAQRPPGQRGRRSRSASRGARRAGSARLEFRHPTCQCSSSSSMSTPSWWTMPWERSGTPIRSPGAGGPWRSAWSRPPSGRRRRPWGTARCAPRWTSGSASGSGNARTWTSSSGRACWPRDGRPTRSMRRASSSSQPPSTARPGEAAPT